MDSCGSYKKIVNEDSCDEDDLFLKHSAYTNKQADSRSTHVRVTQPVSFPKTEEILPSTYLCLSMVACCFCWPMAICALRNSQKSAYAAGAMDYETARMKGKKAMKISIAAIVTGVLLLAIKIAFFVIYMRHLQSDVHYDVTQQESFVKTEQKIPFSYLRLSKIAGFFLMANGDLCSKKFSEVGLCSGCDGFRDCQDERKESYEDIHCSNCYRRVSDCDQDRIYCHLFATATVRRVQ